MANVPSPILKFDTDFDFDLSNAQFIKEELEREVNERMNIKGALSAKVTLATCSRFRICNLNSISMVAFMFQI